MGKTPEDMIAELLQHINALGQQMDQSTDTQAAVAQVAQSLAQLRATLMELDAGDTSETAFAQAIAAIARMRKEMKTAGPEDRSLAGLEEALKPGANADEIAQSLDEQTGNAFSRYRAANEARAMEEITKDARANAEQSAKQVKPDLDFDEVLKRDSPDAKENGTQEEES